MGRWRRESTADGKRPLAEPSATEEEAVQRCDVCHGPLKHPVYQCSSQRYVACGDCGAGQGRSFADLAEDAVNIVSRHLGYFRVPCPNEMYGCGGVAARDAATHAAVCAHAPCACPCPECAFLGSPAQLVRHLSDTAGPHAWPVHNIEYGREFVVKVPEEPRLVRRLLVAEEDSGVFLLVADEPHACHVYDTDLRLAAVVCVRGNAGAGAVYGLLMNALNSTLVMEEMPSSSAPREFDVEGPTARVIMFPEPLHLSVRIDRRRRAA